jgi:hypothetical protein
MSENDPRSVACDFLVLGSAVLLTGLGALTAAGLLMVAIA